MPKVSVILPNFNHLAYLDDRIESIMNQSFQDFELLIFDDASTDGSAELLKKYETHPKISSLIFNQKNSGSTFIQWKKGLELAKGEFIWIAESDDLADPDFLKIQISNFKKNPALGLSFSASSWINEKSEIIHQPDHEYAFNKKGQDLIKTNYVKASVIYNASSCVFRKSLVPWDTLNEISSYKYCGDWLFWVKLIQNTEVSRISQRLNFFRRHQGNVSFKSDANGLQFSEGFKIVNHILETQSFSWVSKQKILLYWVLKVKESSLLKKKQFISLLPFPSQIYYLISPFLVLLRKL